MAKTDEKETGQATNGQTTALVPLNQLSLPPGVDVAGMDEADLRALAAMYARELDATVEGINVRPIRWKIVKETMQFSNPLGQSKEELRGVMVYIQQNRGYWPPGRDSKIPVCSSLDCKTGNPTPEGIQEHGISPGQACSTCAFNKWGSGIGQDGKPRKGKACKEMRRVFLAEDPKLVPTFLSIPPTSITDFDEYVTTRATQGTVNVGAETALSLVEGQSGGYDIAKVRSKIGKTIPPKEWPGYIRQREPMREYADSIGVTDEDYEVAADDAPVGDNFADTDESAPFA